MSGEISPVLPYIFCLIAGYLAGSINFAWLIAKRKGFDIRTKGSGNAGATNAGRTMGLRMAALVLLGDASKAAVMVFLAGAVLDAVPAIQAVTALGCVLGHLYPFYLEFRGGKGITVLLGSALALDWRLALLMAAVIVLLIVITDYMFIGTLTATVLFWVWLLLTGRSTAELIILLLPVLLVFLRHRSNFRRFAKKEELGIRASFFSKKYRV